MDPLFLSFFWKKTKEYFLKKVNLSNAATILQRVKMLAAADLSKMYARRLAVGSADTADKVQPLGCLSDAWWGLNRLAETSGKPIVSPGLYPVYYSSSEPARCPVINTAKFQG